MTLVVRALLLVQITAGALSVMGTSVMGLDPGGLTAVSVSCGLLAVGILLAEDDA